MAGRPRARRCARRSMRYGSTGSPIRRDRSARAACTRARPRARPAARPTRAPATRAACSRANLARTCAAAWHDVACGGRLRLPRAVGRLRRQIDRRRRAAGQRRRSRGRRRRSRRPAVQVGAWGQTLRCGLTGGIGDVREPRVDQVQQRVACGSVGLRAEAWPAAWRVLDRARRRRRAFGHAGELRADRRVAGLAFGEQEQRPFERTEPASARRRVASHDAAGRTHDGS